MCSLYVSAAISFGRGNFFLQWAMDGNCGGSLMTGESDKNNWLRLCHKKYLYHPLQGSGYIVGRGLEEWKVQRKGGNETQCWFLTWSLHAWTHSCSDHLHKIFTRLALPISCHMRKGALMRPHPSLRLYTQLMVDMGGRDIFFSPVATVRGPWCYKQHITREPMSNPKWIERMGVCVGMIKIIYMYKIINLLLYIINIIKKWGAKKNPRWESLFPHCP